ncbi:MAG: DMT family transporter [Desulfobacteraceae bacterium]|nr:MAG: DMT family transporter [Desulfobacteraceae bacterium]
MFETIPHIGEIMALSSAAIWAVAVILFKKSGETAHPISLNLFKNILGILLFFLTMLAFDQVCFRYGSTRDLVYLIVSGFLGIAVSDTLFFKSLNMLGAGVSAIVNCVYSPCIIILSVLFLDEKLSGLQILGILLILAALLSGSSQDNKSAGDRKHWIKGVIYALAGIVAMAVGIVMIKPILERAPLLWVLEVRLLSGVVGLALMLAWLPNRKEIISSLYIKKGWIYIISGSVLGVYFSFLAWMAGMKYAQASIAAPLNQTANLFIFIFAALFLHEPLTGRRIVGILIGLAGVLLTTLG